jgi:dienelactone hydrolase
MPGYRQTSEHFAWWGETFASHGFVVLVVNGEDPNELPHHKVDDFEAGLDYLKTLDNVDGTSLAAIGNSFGGGAAFSLGEKGYDGLKTIIPVVPSGLGDPGIVDGYPDVAVSTLVVAAELDEYAPSAAFAKYYYDSVPDSLDKEYMEIAGISHETLLEYNAAFTSAVVSWMHYFLVDDGRYDDLVLPVAAPEGELSANEHNQVSDPASRPEACEQEDEPTPPPGEGDGGADGGADDGDADGDAPSATKPTPVASDLPVTG